MNPKRLGCLTINGLAAAFLTALIVGGITLARGGSIYSPGDLSARSAEPLGGVSSHAEIVQCSACHTPFWSDARMRDRCLDCHTEIRDQIEIGEGTHYVYSQSGALVCRECHTEHLGSDASITFIDASTFPHDATGFSLHAHSELDGRPFQCTDCHTTPDSFDDFDCLNCHTRLDAVFSDAHIRSFGDSCLTCHDGLETYGTAFSHDLTGFPLEGKHAPLDCLACHQGQHSIEALGSTPADCASCHLEDDAHAGKFGTDCGACHTPEGWEGAAFDHDALRFKLEGKHELLDCEDCHHDLTFQALPHACIDCHQDDDKHQGSFGSGCEKCHTPAGWDQATFDHSTLAFPLVGKHLSLECSACHESYVYKPMPHTCADCHLEDDAHVGELGTGCEQCHTPESWTKIIFDHSTARFQLLGKHADVSCTDCHQGGRFRGLPTQCVACHARDDAHNGAYGSTCELCHTPVGWDTITFDHSKTSFPLTGAHSGLGCTRCHTSGASFTSLSSACSSCHAEPVYHAGLFGSGCQSCHNTSSWVPASFNGSHSFPTGHGGAGSCRSCHPTQLSGYTCYSCHDLGSIAGKHQEEGVADLSNCARCHPTGNEHEGGGEGGGGDGDDD